MRLYFLFTVFNISQLSYSGNDFPLWSKKLEMSSTQHTDSIYVKKILDINDSECTESFLLENMESNIDYTYHATKSITTISYTVGSNNSQINMKAGNVIVLSPNTHIKKGALYLAKIEGCEKQKCIPKSIQKGISADHNDINDNLDLSDNCPIKMLQIFNRYGVNVYEKEKYVKEWSGKDFNGNLLPNGTYYYNILFESGKQETGWIYLNY